SGTLILDGIGATLSVSNQLLLNGGVSARMDVTNGGSASTGFVTMSPIVGESSTLNLGGGGANLSSAGSFSVSNPTQGGGVAVVNVGTSSTLSVTGGNALNIFGPGTVN